jgi:hypothetical protein
MEEYKIQKNGYQKSKDGQTSEEPSVEASPESKPKKSKKEKIIEPAPCSQLEMAKLETIEKSSPVVSPADPVQSQTEPHPLLMETKGVNNASGSDEVKEKKKKKKHKNIDAIEPGYPSKADTSDELTQSYSSSKLT